MQRLPSAKSLKEAFSKHDGVQIRKLLEGRTDPLTLQSVESWVHQCHNAPDHTELVMCAINEIIGGHGVESVKVERPHYTDHHLTCVASYVNMGDTYNVTILCDHTRNDTFYLTTYGSWLELYERRKS